MGFKGRRVRVPDSNYDVKFSPLPSARKGSDSIYGTRLDFIIAGDQSYVFLVTRYNLDVARVARKAQVTST